MLHILTDTDEESKFSQWAKRNPTEFFKFLHDDLSKLIWEKTPLPREVLPYIYEYAFESLITTAFFSLIAQHYYSSVKLYLSDLFYIQFFGRKEILDNQGNTLLGQLLLSVHYTRQKEEAMVLMDYLLENNSDLTIRNQKKETVFTIKKSLLPILPINPQITHQYLPKLILKLYQQKKIKPDQQPDTKSLVEWTGIDNNSLKQALLSLRLKNKSSACPISDLTIIKFLQACGIHLQEQYECGKLGVSYTLLTSAVIDNNQESYDYLREQGMKFPHNALLTLVQTAELRNLGPFLKDFVLDHPVEGPMLWADAILKAIRAFQNQKKLTYLDNMIYLFHQHECELTEEQLISIIEYAFVYSLHFNTKEVVQIILESVNKEKVTDLIFFKALASVIYPIERVVHWVSEVLIARPQFERYLAEFFTRYCLRSAYWRQHTGSVYLIDILDHVRGLHQKKYFYNTATRYYSGKGTLDTLYSFFPLKGKKTLWGHIKYTRENFGLLGPEQITQNAKEILAECIISAIVGYRQEKGEAWYAEAHQQIMSLLEAKSESEEKSMPPPSLPTVGDLQRQFPEIDWEQDKPVTSWSRGFFSPGRIKMSLGDYMMQMRRSNLNKYQKICSALQSGSEEKIQQAFAMQRFWAKRETTVGEQIYHQAKPVGSY